MEQLRVLFLEDVATEVEIILRQLASRGLRCTWLRVDSEDGFRAALGEFRPDLILSDFSLPGFDGLAALEIAVAEAPDIPFMFVSGTLGEERAVEALKRGATDYVLKSNLLRLTSAVERALAEAASRRARKAAEAQAARLLQALQMLSGINTAAVRIRQREPLLQEACRLAVQLGSFRTAAVALVQPGTGTARLAAWSGQLPERLRQASFTIADSDARDESLTSRTIRSGEACICIDLRRPGMPVFGCEELLAAGIRCMGAFPLLIEQTPIGALILGADQPEAIGSEERRLLQEVTTNLAFALQYLEKDEAVQFLSYFDPMTGLAKRSLFCERLGRHLATPGAPDREVVVAVFDIERLSTINDSLGYHSGNLLLQSVADRLKQHFDTTESLAHLSGGVFALMKPMYESRDAELRVLQEQVSGLFESPFEMNGHSIRVHVRTGWSCYPENGRDAGTLLQNAEAALKRAKESGEEYLHHRLEMKSQAVERLDLEQRLHAALAQRQFVLHYQPKLSLRSSRIVGVEALLRWLHPEKGLLFPSVFLPVLESTGLIVRVGEWALRQAVADCGRWRHLGFPDLRVAVNISPLQLRRRSFVDEVLGALGGASMVDDCRLDIEITEGALLDDPALVVPKLKALRAAGVRIAIDDFGTGYSSLSRLSQLPVDTLKIDRSFITQISEGAAGGALVQTIVSLARTFGMSTVAEGVESREQLEFLAQAGCDESQGHLHGRPLPLESLESLLLAHSGSAAP